MENKKRVEKLSAVQEPRRVKILILTDQKTIYSDFYFINKFTNLVKLDLSYNKLSNFPVGFGFQPFPHMRELFLHYNKFATIKSVHVVTESSSLEYLTLFGNPLEEAKIRHFFVNQIPSLKLMDDKIVRMDERNPELLLNWDPPIVKLTFPLFPAESEGGAYFLSSVISELRLIRKKYLQANPIVRIQRWLKGKLNKKKKQTQRNDFAPFKAQESGLGKIKVEIAQPRKLKTQKLDIQNSSEDKVVSLLMMNVAFLAVLRTKADGEVYALREFCQQHHIQYEDTHRIICLKVPEQHYAAKTHLQLILDSGKGYLLRRRGSEEAMNIRSKYRLLSKLLKKNYRYRSSKGISKLKGKRDTKLSARLQQKQQRYLNRVVIIRQQPQILFTILKKHYYQCLRTKTRYPFIIEEVCNRSMAAVAIQRAWRGYVVRKQINAYHIATRHHAAWVIQNSVRNLGFRSRSGFFAEIGHYAKMEENSCTIVLEMSTVLALESRRSRILKGVNFVLQQQKLRFGVEEIDNQVFWEKKQQFCLPAYFRTQMPVPIKQQKHGPSNILDLIFKGCSSIKYIEISPSPHHKKNIHSDSLARLQKQSSQNRSIADAKPKQEIENSTQKMRKYSNKYVIGEFQSSHECLLRKIVLAIATYSLADHEFAKSLHILIKPNAVGIKNITDRVKDHFFINQYNEDSEYSYPLLQLREKSHPYKIKYFVQQTDLTTKIQAYLPISDKTKISLTLPLKNRMKASENNGPSSIRSIRELRGVHQTAIISRNAISLLPSPIDSLNSQSNFLSYRDALNQLPFQKYRYHEYQKEDKARSQKEDKARSQKEEDKARSQKDEDRARSQKEEDKVRSLQKNRSLQSPKNQQAGMNFLTERNLEKSYATEAYMEVLETQSRNREMSSLRDNSADDDQESKKRKIYMQKDEHRERIQENTRYKQEELSRLRIKVSDEQESNRKAMETSRREESVHQAKKRALVKRALNQKLSDIQQFEKDFMKRGNSSIRKDLIKFEQERSNNSPDNASVSESMKSLQADLLKNQHSSQAKQIFHIKTQIKEFSMYGGEDESEINIELGSKNKETKEFPHRLYEKEKQEKEGEEATHREISQRRQQKKKKKLVHSVFPQEFYPMKEARRIGFQLPRIGKR